MNSKEAILETLSKLNVSQLDVMKDKKIVEHREAEKRLFIAKEALKTAKRGKRKQLKIEGNSLNRIDQLLRNDETLYPVIDEVDDARELKLDIEFWIELINSAYWRAKQ